MRGCPGWGLKVWREAGQEICAEGRSPVRAGEEGSGGSHLAVEQNGRKGEVEELWGKAAEG